MINKKWLALLIPALMAGCTTTSSSDNATSGGYYEETPNEVVFESLDDIFEAEESALIPENGQIVESKDAILNEGGYTKLNVEELEQKGVDLTVLDQTIVNFAFDSYKVDTKTKELIARHAALLNEVPDLKVILEGHTDKRGDRAYNLKLGENRAIAVKDILVSEHRVSPERVEIISFGKERLIEQGEADSAHRMNRRAEFRYQ